MRLPDFLIIGAAKSGTTTLYRYLCHHSQIYMSPHKEPSFFARDEVYARGIEWYAALFDEANPEQICGEASTDYTKFPRWPHSAERIAQWLPQVKMIYIMRNPVDRAYSYYVHINRGLKVDETFEEHLEKTSICLDGSRYLLQIKRYLQFFPQESFLFLLLEDLTEQPNQTLSAVCQFLGIAQDFDFNDQGTITANSGKNWFEQKMRVQLTAPIKAIPGAEATAALLPRQWRDWVYHHLISGSFYGKQIKQQYINPPMLPETRQRLIAHYRPLNQQLSEFLNRDLSLWNQ
ncbi:MAG: sulfotransferase domain-containing protein [Cyanophyceae cyanobacterium]